MQPTCPITSVKTLGQRIKEVRTELRMSQSVLAKAAGVATSTIGNLESGIRDKPREIVSIAKVLGVNAAWLETGRGTRTPMDFDGDAEQRLGSNVEALQARVLVPLISWVLAGSWSDVSDPFQQGDAEGWLPCPVHHGPRSFCLKVRGDSMFNPGGRPSYSEGDILFIDPDTDVNAGDRVVVRLDDEKQATFKQYMEEDGKKYLKALNPAWVPRYMEIDGNATICGKVIGTWKPE
jgi:SOS-response transcriptional repressor LexA